MHGNSIFFRRISLASIALLLAGSVLAVLGISNAFLKWHSFSRAMEKLYFAALWSTLSLSAFCVFITLVVGIGEAIRLLRPPPGEGKRGRSAFGVYLQSMGLL